MDYAIHLLMADKHIRMAYHHAEIKQIDKAIDEAIQAVASLKLLVTLLNDEQSKKQRLG